MGVVSAAIAASTGLFGFLDILPLDSERTKFIVAVTGGAAVSIASYLAERKIERKNAQHD